MAKDGMLAAVPAPAEFPGPLQAFLCIEPLVLYALSTLVPGLFLLPAVLVCVASLGRGCFLMGAVAVGLGDAAFRLLPTAGPGGRVFRVFGAAFLPGPAALELSLLPWALPGRGKENSKVRPSTRLGGACVHNHLGDDTVAGSSPFQRGAHGPNQGAPGGAGSVGRRSRLHSMKIKWGRPQGYRIRKFPGLQAALPASLLGFSGLNSRHSRRFQPTVGRNISTELAHFNSTRPLEFQMR